MSRAGAVLWKSQARTSRHLSTPKRLARVARLLPRPSRRSWRPEIPTRRTSPRSLKYRGRFRSTLLWILRSHAARPRCVRSRHADTPFDDDRAEHRRRQTRRLETWLTVAAREQNASSRGQRVLLLRARSERPRRRLCRSDETRAPDERDPSGASVRRRWRESSKRLTAPVGADAPFRGIAQARAAAPPKSGRRKCNRGASAGPRRSA